jgi:SAM-dependent methyltransferase
MNVLSKEAFRRPAQAIAASVRGFFEKVTAGNPAGEDGQIGAAGFTPKQRSQIRASINKKYNKVARRPDGLFKYPTGKAGLQTLQYDPNIINALSDNVSESYCGVGNPFSIGAIPNEGRVLDIGCGGGVDTIVAAMMAGAKGHATGIDMVPDMLQRARGNLGESRIDNVTFVEASAEQIPLADNSFDVVISNGVFNLIVDKVKALNEVFRVLKPGGSFQIADQFRNGELPKETSVIVKSWGR